MKKIGIFFVTLCLLVWSNNSNTMEDTSSPIKKLIVAAYNGNLEECRINLQLVSDPNKYLAAGDHDINTGEVPYELNALSAAALTKHNDIIDLLFNPPTDTAPETPINVNEASPEEGFTPLFMAIFGNNLDGLQLLLANDANANVADNNTKDTPLMKAAFIKAIGDNPEFVKALLAKGANPNAQNASLDTALSFAILNKHVLTAKALIPVTDVKLADKNGNTPLHQAAALGLDEIVKLLIEKGADLNAKNKNGTTALELANKRLKNSTALILTQAAEEAVASTNPIDVRPPSNIEPDLVKSLNSLDKSLRGLQTALS